MNGQKETDKVEGEDTGLVLQEANYSLWATSGWTPIFVQPPSNNDFYVFFNGRKSKEG